MADEIMTAPEEQALFQLSNGRYIMDEAQSRVMFQIKEAQPEHSHPISGTGYSWDESGMAELFSECYKNDTRYCPEDIPLCPCQKQRCAWWDEDSQDCAAVVLARAMKKRK